MLMKCILTSTFVSILHPLEVSHSLALAEKKVSHKYRAFTFDDHNHEK